MLDGVDQRDDLVVLAIRPLTDEIHLSRGANPELLLPTRRLLRRGCVRSTPMVMTSRSSFSAWAKP